MVNRLTNRVSKGGSVCPRCNGTGHLPDWKALGKKWKISRIERDLKLKDVARCLGVSPAYISALENGKKPWPHGMEFRYLSALKRESK